MNNENLDKKPTFVFDLHDVLFARNYITTLKLIARIQNKIDLCKILFNPKFLYDAYKMLSITRVSEAYIIKLSEKHYQLEPFVETIIDITNALTPIQEMFILIENLKLKGYRIYIFSNIGYRTYQKLTQPFQHLFDYFDGIHHVQADNNWLAKPNQNAYLLFLKTVNVNPKNMVFVDDKPKNVIAAQKLGITALQYKSCKLLYKQLSDMRILT
jgi:HAD superfamily hydrolase (TIGR01509 family)